MRRLQAKLPDNLFGSESNLIARDQLTSRGESDLTSADIQEANASLADALQSYDPTESAVMGTSRTPPSLSMSDTDTPHLLTKDRDEISHPHKCQMATSLTIRTQLPHRQDLPTSQIPPSIMDPPSILEPRILPSAIASTRPRLHGLRDGCLRASRNGKHREAERLWTQYYKNQSATNQRKLDRFLKDIQITNATTEFMATQQQLIKFITDKCRAIMPASRLRILLQEIRQVYERPNDWTDSSEQIQLARSRGELLDYDAGLIRQDEELVTTIGLEASILRKQQHLRFLGLQPDDLKAYLQATSLE